MDPSASDIAALVRQLNSGGRAAQLKALKALVRLTPVSTEQLAAAQAVVAAGGPAALVQLVCAGSSGEVVQAAAADVLANIAMVGRAAPLVDAGAVPALAGQLGRGSAATQAAAARALGNIAFQGAAQCRAIGAAGAIPRLLQLLDSSCPIAARQGTTALFTLSAAGGIESGAAIAVSGGIPCLARLLARLDLDPVAVLRGVRLLANLLVSYRDGLAALEAAGGARVLVQLLQRSSDPEALAAALMCLHGLALSAASHAAVLAAGGLGVLPGLLASPEPAVRLEAAKVTCAIAAAGSKEGCAAMAAQPGCIEALLQIVRDGGGSENCLVLAATTLADLALGTEQLPGVALPGGRAVAACPGAISLLVQRAGSTSDGKAAAACTAVLRNLSTVPEAAEAIAAEGGVPAALQQLSGAGEAGDAAAALLSNLAMHPFARGAVLEGLTATGAATALRRLQASSAVGSIAHTAASQLLLFLEDPAVAEPAAARLMMEIAAAVCAAPGCGATHGLRRCGGCGAVRYCSEACSRAHWRAHKAECRRLCAERDVAAQASDDAQA